VHETHSQSVFATHKGLDVAHGHSIDSSRPKLLCRFRHPVTADNRSCFQDHSVNTCTVSTTIDSFSRCCRGTDIIRAVQHLFRYESCGDPWANIVRLTMRPYSSSFLFPSGRFVRVFSVPSATLLCALRPGCHATRCLPEHVSQRLCA
jgi:hypothetical protein